MSERLSSVEIEDVLSSIRRLVSEDLRPVAKPAEGAAGATPAVAASEGPGRLLLTPSLRIAPEPAEEEEETVSGPTPFLSRRGDADGARLEAVLGEAARTLDPATEEDAAPAAPAASVPDWFIEEEVAAALPAEAPVAEVEPAATLAEVELAPAVEAAELDAAVADGDGWAATEAEAVVADAPEAVAEAELAGDVVDAPGDWPEVEAETPHVVEMAGEAGVIEAEVLTDGFASDLADPVTEAVAEPEPVQATDDPYWADAAEAEIRRELEEEAEATVFARFDAGQDMPEEPLYDEEMLRDLVRDIIREELQGALGERITRNVRKLVRAEIARALAVRDFE